ERLPAAATRWPGCDTHAAQLLDRADVREPLGETRSLNQRSIGGARRRVDVDRQLAKAAQRLGSRGCGRRLEHGRGHLLEVAPGDWGGPRTRKKHLPPP